MQKHNSGNARKFDLHIHSRHSKDINSREEIARIVQKAKKLGLSGIAITDHNNTLAFPEISKIKKSEKELMVIKGEEVMVKEKDGSIGGELLCYFLQEEIRPAGFHEIIDAARKQDALVSIAHAFEKSRFGLEKINERFRKADAIEAFNSRASSDEVNLKAANFALENKMPITAGSDAHTLIEIGRAGIECSAEGEEELRKAILKGKCKVFGKRTSIASKIWLKKNALLRRIGFGHE